ncbi:hypothetical protein LK09_07220 [Microbacterium mangrovi]|uniref:DUF2993 domain-containing protein n=1 Tax=Microbacterium mangrovi TaxID=1348253 RepID=A0A0B2ABL9_9MICO|nr:DUF2993 domain-containing protein [Microbacterium mangrovi]KHK99031.1 hypothetical protein LK09_07220 [Microbacterium mangrovi]
MTTDTSPRRRRWPWAVALLVVIGLLVAAWFIADSLARGLVTTAVRTAVIQKLHLPADQPVDVDIEGMVIPQLIGGTFHDVRVASDDVPIGDTAADVAVQLKDVEYRGATPGKMSAGNATVTLTEAQLRSLATGIHGIDPSSIGLKEPDVTASTRLSLFGASIEVGIGLKPSAKSGALVLTPASFTVGSATLNASDLAGRFGSLADPITQPRSICIADKIPAGVTLTGVRVSGATLVADFAIDGDLAVDAALQQKGSCS